MSFALEFRKQQQQKQREAARERDPGDGFVAAPADASADTRGNRRRVMLALVIAGSVLGVFNSEGLVRYTQNLAGNPVGEKLIVLSERWHEMMQRKQATRVVEKIRGSLALVREASWRDLTFGFTRVRDEPPLPDQPQPNIVPAGQETPLPPEPEQLETAKPVTPVLRASAEPRL